jgi:general secretion pathway protein G
MIGSVFNKIAPELSSMRAASIKKTAVRFLVRRKVMWRTGEAGYTLLELLVVMGILAVLTAIATPQLMGYFGKAKTQSVHLQIENIGTALELYYMENGSYPSAGAGLKALVEATPEAPRWNGPYLKKAKNLLDPWGRPYQYRYPTQSGEYEVYSLGPNGKAASTSVAGMQPLRGS